MRAQALATRGLSESAREEALADSQRGTEDHDVVMRLHPLTRGEVAQLRAIESARGIAEDFFRRRSAQS